MNLPKFYNNESYDIVTASGALMILHTAEGVIKHVFDNSYINKVGETIAQYKLVLELFVDYNTSNPPVVCFTIPEKLLLKYKSNLLPGRTAGVWFTLTTTVYQKDGVDKYVLNPRIFRFEDTHEELEELLVTNDISNFTPKTITPEIFDNNTHKPPKLPTSNQDIIDTANKLHSMLVDYEYLLSSNLGHSLDMVMIAINNLKRKQAKTLGLLDDNDDDLPF